MKPILPRIKDVSVWISLFLGMYFVLALIISSRSASVAQLDLLELPSQFIFGHKINTSSDLSFKLDEQGEAAIFFQSSNILATTLDSLQVEIEGLNNNYQVDLVWKTFDNSVPFEQQLLQPNGDLQVNLIKFNPNWSSPIEQLGLRISPHLHLGLTIAETKEISIKQLIFKPVSILDSLGLIKDYWMEYDAWSYKSINHSSVNMLLPIYAQPLIFISVWLLIGIIYNNIFSNKSANIYIILIAWLLSDTLFISDMNSRSQWVKRYYSTEDKMLPDQNLYQLAKQIKSLLNLDIELSNKNQRILILSSNSYQRSRLIYHLLPVNSGFFDIFTESSRESNVYKGDYILSYDVARNPKRAVSGKLIFNNSTLNVKEVATGPQYSLMKVE